ncbi:hypothetical protein [Streptomyces sp. NPDC059008]|uniref:hypothetical protein n=1 Tax=Streptomyces sp. NPDC059008 TaxID=3346693 RepID=UPI0036AE3B8F
MKKNPRRWLAIAAPAVVLASLTVAAPEASASSAAAAGCVPVAHPNKDADIGYADSTRTVVMRTGPSASCGTVVTLKSSWKMDLYCEHFNGSNWWIYAKVAGTNAEGWVYAANVTVPGSKEVATC